MPSSTYREPTKAHIARFGTIFEAIKQTVEKQKPDIIGEREPSDDTHFRDTDIGARIEFKKGEMLYWVILDARRIQPGEEVGDPANG